MNFEKITLPYSIGCVGSLDLTPTLNKPRLWRIEHVLADLRADRLRAVRRLGKADSAYRKITFHKEHLDQDQHLDAVLIGPGHPL